MVLELSFTYLVKRSGVNLVLVVARLFDWPCTVIGASQSSLKLHEVSVIEH